MIILLFLDRVFAANYYEYLYYKCKYINACPLSTIKLNITQ